MNQNDSSPASEQPTTGKRILAINASPRGKSGNTDRLLRSFLQGAAGTNATVETVYLRSTKIHHCSGCLTCWTTTPGMCAHKDDMPALLEKIRQAEILVYAVPLYAYSVTGLMKNYLDRNLPLVLPYLVSDHDQYVHPMRHPEAWPKKLVVISTCGFPERHHFSGLVETFHRLTSRPALNLAGMILCPAGELLRVVELQAGVQWYLDATAQAGREVCESGRITAETEAVLSRPLVTDTEELATMANAQWDRLLARHSTVGTPGDLLGP